MSTRPPIPAREVLARRWKHIAPARRENTPRVAALYVDSRRGPYPCLPMVDTWPEERDATQYFGTAPIVAHPPCGHWGRFHWKESRADKKWLAPFAVCQLARYGGVLEHPRDSKLWKVCGLPLPGELPFRGFWTLEVDQGWWGHAAPKRTWLLFSRVPRNAVSLPAARPIAAGRVVNMPKTRRHLTPPAFARWLVECARAVPHG